MNSKIIDGITNIDGELIEKYWQYKQACLSKRRMRIKRVVGTAVACFALVIAVIIAFMSTIGNNSQIIYNSYGKIDITSLSGAEIVDTDEDFFVSSNGDIDSSDGWVSNIKKSSMTVVYGTAKNIKTVKIEDWKGHIWYITTFEIDVIKEIKNCDGAKTITVASVSHFKGNLPVYDYGMSSDIKIAKKKTGLFTLKKNSDDIWRIGCKKYAASDLADYYVMGQYDCDGESVDYYGTSIDLNDIIG